VVLYDYKCLKCGRVFEEFSSLEDRAKTKCSCGGDAVQIIKHIGKDWFHPFISEDFNGEPIEVTSKKRYRELCKEHGVQARALL
jgi:putative FmdB family regulatory protein